MDSRRFIHLLTAVLLFLLPAVARAQRSDGGTFGFGYVANAPQILAGGTMWGLLPGMGGWGVYLDAKIDPEHPVGDGFFMDGVSPVDVELRYPDDEEVTQEDRWRSFNAAAAYELTPELIVYGGGGYASRTVYRQYIDPDRERGDYGFYWVEDEASSTGELNLLAGALLRISSRLRLQFGGETVPGGFTVGASLVLGGR